MLEINLATIIFQVVNFLVLFGILYFLLFKRIIERANNRKKELEDIRQQTLANFEKSEDLRKQLEESLDTIHEQVDEYISNAKAELEVDRYQVLEETKKQAEQLIKQAQSNAAVLQTREIEENQDKVLGTIIQIVENIINNSVPDEFHESLVEQINDRVWDMGKKEMRNVDLIRKSLAEREPTLSVVTPRQLTKEQQAAIIRTFSALADKNVKLQITKDQSLISGLRIRLGDYIIDNSVKAKLDSIKENTMDEFREKLQVLSKE